VLQLEKANELGAYIRLSRIITTSRRGTKAAAGRDVFIAMRARLRRSRLELGCGTGRVTMAVAEAGKRITGLELSERMLRARP